MRRYREDPVFRDEVISAAQNRRADRLGVGWITSPKTLTKFLLARDNRICGICREAVLETTGPWRPSIDHIIPLNPASGPRGEHTLENLQLAHYRCNLQKHNRIEPPTTAVGRRGGNHATSAGQVGDGLIDVEARSPRRQVA